MSKYEDDIDELSKTNSLDTYITSDKVLIVCLILLIISTVIHPKETFNGILYVIKQTKIFSIGGD